MDEAGKGTPPAFAETRREHRVSVLSRPMLPALSTLAPGPRQGE